LHESTSMITRWVDPVFLTTETQRLTEWFIAGTGTQRPSVDLCASVVKNFP
jgi:hypothetical protein